MCDDGYDDMRQDIPTVPTTRGRDIHIIWRHSYVKCRVNNIGLETCTNMSETKNKMEAGDSNLTPPRLRKRSEDIMVQLVTPGSG